MPANALLVEKQNAMADHPKIDEYKEAVASHRFQNGLLIGELTVYLAVMGVLLNAALSDTKGNTIIISLLGAVITVAFFVICERAGDFSHAARRRAASLESELGFKLYSAEAPRKSIATAINAIRVVYGCAFLMWISVFARMLVK